MFLIYLVDYILPKHTIQDLQLCSWRKPFDRARVCIPNHEKAAANVGNYLKNNLVSLGNHFIIILHVTNYYREGSESVQHRGSCRDGAIHKDWLAVKIDVQFLVSLYPHVQFV
jgi:hypothetical protein